MLFLVMVDQRRPVAGPSGAQARPNSLPANLSLRPLNVHGWTNAAEHMDVRERRTSSKNIANALTQCGVSRILCENARPASGRQANL